MKDTAQVLVENGIEPAVYIKDGAVCAFSSRAKAMFPPLKPGLCAVDIFPEEILSLGGEVRSASGTWGDCTLLETDGGQVYLFRPVEETEQDCPENVGIQLRNHIQTAMLAANQMVRGQQSLDYPSILRKSLCDMLRTANHLCFLGETKPATDMREVDFAWLVREVCRTAETFTGREIQVECPECLGLWGDGRLLGRMLLCLLSNALKFAPEGRILVAVYSDRERVVVTVRDPGSDGNGRWERSRFDPARGVGLGLDVVRKVAALHNGTVLISFTPGKGTLVTVTLSGQREKVFTLRDGGRSEYYIEQPCVLEELCDLMSLEKFKTMYEE